LAPAADLALFEATHRLGGPLDTHRSGELLVERGADSFLTRQPWAVELCQELGLGAEILPTSPDNRRALIVSRGKLEPVPTGFVLMQPRKLWPVLRSPVLSLRGKLRMMVERLIPAPAAVRTPGHDESIATFARRRLGREAFERLVQPLMAGIYVADAEKLSLAATMPEFLAAERDYGSLRRALRSKHLSNLVDPHPAGLSLPDASQREAGTGAEAEAGARYGAFVTLKAGLSSLIEALAARLPAVSVRLSTPVTEVSKSADGRWLVATGGDVPEQFDGVIIAAPAKAAADMLWRMDQQLGDLLSRIETASSVVATLIYRRGQMTRLLNGFGFVVPQVERRSILAASFPSVKFPGRGDANLVPIRVFLGGALDPQMMECDDDELGALAHRELADLIDVVGEPHETIIARWPESMPQYRVGHLALVESVERRVADYRGLELAGNSYRGVGIPQCIRSGRDAAERLCSVVLTI
jgi:oxygen-dependent protoporphyrinogen oxidase